MKKTSINLGSLSEEELIKLNEQIIKRLKELRDQNRFQQISQFKMGDIVSFPRDGQKEEGLIIRINQKTVSVMTVTYAKWILSPGLLIKEQKPSEKIRVLQSKLFPKR